MVPEGRIVELVGDPFTIFKLNVPPLQIVPDCVPIAGFGLTIIVKLVLFPIHVRPAFV